MHHHMVILYFFYINISMHCMETHFYHIRETKSLGKLLNHNYYKKSVTIDIFIA